VVAEERYGDAPGPAPYPEEAAVVAGAVERRRREFTTVRLCARSALARLGAPPGPVLPQGSDGPRWARGAPRWPDGVVGSMTHCEGFRAAAVAHRAAVASVGVDAEPHEVLPRGVESVIAGPEERDALARAAAAHPGVAWSRVLFSAKESVYKAWFPLTGRWLGFDQCRITLQPRDGTFTADLLVPGPVVGGRRVERFTGRWRVSGAVAPHHGRGHIVTAVAVPAHAGPGGGAR